MAARTSAVNLLPTDRFEFSRTGRFLIWALSTGRLVVILTELVVILAFLSRFWLDRQLSDLRRLRFEKTQVAQSFEDTRIQWDKTRRSIQAAQDAIAAQFDAASRLEKIQALTPGSVEYDSIEIGSQSAAIRGFAPASGIFSRLHSAIKADASTELLEVKRLEQSSDRSPGFDFELELIPKQTL